jgi:hypothetical protein
MNLFDTFMDDFYNEKYMQGISDLDQRAQLEVSTHFISQHFAYLLTMETWVQSHVSPCVIYGFS